MSSIIKINIPNNSFVSYSVSVLFHAAVLISVLVILNLSDDRARMNPRFVQVTTQDYSTNNAAKESKPALPPKTAAPKEDKSADKENENKNADTVKQNLNNAFYSLSDSSADTSSLDQVYKEPTLNVTIKYPAGWTYIDQNVNKRLDGVTFWYNIGNFSPPPYINLEVRDKDLFDAGRYKYNTSTWGFTIYYNDPEEMEGQVTQVFYIRTNIGEDFSFKLIMKGEEVFKAFQPVFFGMIKSFKFGKGLF